MKKTYCVFAITLFSGITVAQEQSIFNGKDLAGWDSAPGWWTVEDGALTAESTAEKPCKKCNYLIWKDGQPSDFELTCDFKLSASANSGIQIRSERRPNWDTYGYQADMTGNGSIAYSAPGTMPMPRHNADMNIIAARMFHGGSEGRSPESF